MLVAEKPLPPVRNLVRLVGGSSPEPVAGQGQGYHTQPKRRLERPEGWMRMRERGQKPPPVGLTCVMQEALCSSVSLKACRVIQVLLNLVSPHLWNRTLTVNLSWPLASLSLSTCSERREADTRREAGRAGSDMTCKKKKKKANKKVAQQLQHQLTSSTLSTRPQGLSSSYLLPA